MALNKSGPTVQDTNPACLIRSKVVPELPHAYTQACYVGFHVADTCVLMYPTEAILHYHS